MSFSSHQRVPVINVTIYLSHVPWVAHDPSLLGPAFPRLRYLIIDPVALDLVTRRCP